MPKKGDKTIIIRLLTLINDGVCQAKYPAYLGLSRQNIQYWLKMMRQDGLIVIQVKGFTVINEITELGKDYLVKNVKNLVKIPGTATPAIFTGSDKEAPRFHNIHDLSFLFDIRKEAEIWMPNETTLNNDVKARWDWFGDTRITVFHGKNGKAVSLQLQTRIEDDNPHRATWLAYQRAGRFSQMLTERLGIELGFPVLNRRPHYTIRGDKAVDEISKRMTIHTDVGHIDRSHDTGEAEYYTPDNAEKYLKMPMTLDEHSQKLDTINATLQRMETNGQQQTEILGRVANVLEGKAPAPQEPKAPDKPPVPGMYG